MKLEQAEANVNAVELRIKEEQEKQQYHSEHPIIIELRFRRASMAASVTQIRQQMPV